MLVCYTLIMTTLKAWLYCVSGSIKTFLPTFTIAKCTKRDKVRSVIV